MSHEQNLCRERWVPLGRADDDRAERVETDADTTGTLTAEKYLDLTRIVRTNCLRAVAGRGRAPHLNELNALALQERLGIVHLVET